MAPIRSYSCAGCDDRASHEEYEEVVIAPHLDIPHLSSWGHYLSFDLLSQYYTPSRDIEYIALTNSCTRMRRYLLARWVRATVVWT